MKYLCINNRFPSKDFVSTWNCLQYSRRQHHLIDTISVETNFYIDTSNDAKFSVEKVIVMQKKSI